MDCVAIAKSLTTFIPIVQSNDVKLIQKARNYIAKISPKDIISIVSGSDDYGCPRAEEYLWE